MSGWGWQDNGYGTGVLGPLVYFAATGPQTIRIQQREDGISLDQIVLSPALYLTAAPGVTKQDTLVLPLPTAPPPPAAGAGLDHRDRHQRGHRDDHRGHVAAHRRHDGRQRHGDRHG